VFHKLHLCFVRLEFNKGHNGAKSEGAGITKYVALLHTGPLRFLWITESLLALLALL